MVIWKGWGILALVIPILCSLVTGTALDYFYVDNFYKNSESAMPLVLLLSAVLVLFVGNKLNNKPGRKLIDPESNELVELKETHTMFWVPLQYWSVIIIAVSAWMYLANIGFIYQK